ncbi:MAG: hypothetical protein V3T88_01540 [Nitrosomonadaceae bacterium]
MPGVFSGGGQSNEFDEVITNGVQFPSTQVPSSDPNNLDDYEEGTWTPVATFQTPGDLVVVYSFQVGLYTKIGRQVTITMNVDLSTFTHTTASGQFRITGLPFTSASLPSGIIWAGTTTMDGVTKANYTDFTARLGQAGSLLVYDAEGSGQAISTIDSSDMPTGGVPTIRTTMSYFV